MSQLVKHKDTGLYLQLYIPIDLEKNIQYTYIYDITRYKEIMRKKQENIAYYMRH